METPGTIESYREALAATVYEDPFLEAERKLRIIVGAVYDPFLWVENKVTSAVYRIRNFFFTKD